jgi:putative phosphoesterase
MRIGLISDIHGSLWGLEKALALLEREGVDTILCAGDLVERNPQGREVVALIRERQIPCVQGNHDAHAEDNQRWLRGMGATLFSSEWILDDETLAYLRGLPLSLTFEFEGTRLLLAHATPWDQSTYVMPRGNPFLYYRVAEAADADLVVLGHTHEPMRVDVSKHGVEILNPGSVGDPRGDSGRHTCAILSLPERDCQFFDLKTDEMVSIQRHRL